MKKLKRKDMSLYLLMCEKDSYQIFKDVFGEKVRSVLFLHCLYQNATHTFRSVVSEVLNNETLVEMHDMQIERFGYSSVDSLIETVESYLGMADKGNPIYEKTHVFQLFTLDWGEEEKENWGLRGNPNLCAAIARELNGLRIKDINRFDLYQKYCDAYKKYTGKPLEPGEPFYVREFDPGLGGMSAGAVYAEWFAALYGRIVSRLEEVIHESDEKAKIKEEGVEYIILDPYEMNQLYIEYDGGRHCVHYLEWKNEWVDGGNDLNDARWGFDESEPEDSPYRFGNASCMYDLKKITKEEAEEIVGDEINPYEIRDKIITK